MKKTRKYGLFSNETRGSRTPETQPLKPLKYWAFPHFRYEMFHTFLYSIIKVL